MNRARPLAARSIVNPNSVRAFYINMAALSQGVNATDVDPKCLYFLRIVHMVSHSDSPHGASFRVRGRRCVYLTSLALN